MLNGEKYKCEILQLVEHDMSFAFNVNTNKVTSCALEECDDCLFKDTGRTCSFFRTKWLLSEHKEPILTEAEREYLSAVCKPYMVDFIFKDDFNNSSYGQICMKLDGEYITLPTFEINDMYKGMVRNKTYTPQELGITCKNNPKGEIEHENC